MGSHKKTTSQSILELVNPVPVQFDPEDDVNSDSVAKVVENYREEFSDDDTVISKFKKSIDLLEDQDARYSGRKVSRRSLDVEKRKNKVLISGSSRSDNSFSEEDAEIESLKSDDSGESEDDAKCRDSEDNDDAATDDDVVDTDSNDEGEDSATDDSLSITPDAKHIAENRQVTGIESDNFQHVSNRNATLEIEKGRCVRNQLRMWDSLLECRIHLQKCLLTANRMPSHAMFEDYKLKGGTELKETLNKTQNFVTDLLEKFIVMRETLLRSFPETNDLSIAKKCSQAGVESADEEIPSDTEEETDLLDDGIEDKALYEPKVKKRKIDEYATVLDTQHKEYQEYRNSTIQKWNDKTRVSSGKLSSRNFSNFEQSTLKQIEQILSNRHRLIQRTQLKRSTYSPICQPTPENGSAKNGEPNELETPKEYDPEIFDDSDFYHQLLRELIERKTAGVTDPVQLGRQWLQLQKLRSKMKRKVDVRATKGRRIKYVVHPKLVNFMAPIAESNWTDEAKTELYNSLFGKKKL